MAKVRGPAFSLGASKSIGEAVAFRPHRGGTVVQVRSVPADADSAAQQPQRTLFRTILPWWHALLPASRETYRLINPKVNQNAAYINFMGYQLVNQLVDHHTQHEKAQGDPLRVEKQDSSAVGPSAAPLYNIVYHNPYVSVYDSGWTSTYINTWLDLSAHIPSNAIAVLVIVSFVDTGSAGALAYGVVFGVQNAANIYAIAPHINNAWRADTVLVGDITLQQIRHRVIATGVNTARLTIDLLAHIEPAEE